MTKELKHWGILGMRWGNRKSRLGNSTITSSDHRATSKLKRKKISEMSNEELKKLTTRLQLEKQYKDLTKSEIGTGQKLIGEIIQNAGKQLASKYLANALEGGTKNLIEILKNKGG